MGGVGDGLEFAYKKCESLKVLFGQRLMIKETKRASHAGGLVTCYSMHHLEQSLLVPGASRQCSST